METPTIEEFQEARRRIQGVAVRTPLVELHESSGVSDVFLKLETMQPINSFKIRGIFNAVARMDESERARGLFTTSAGNTAQALAWCGRYFGVEARSMMPHGAPQSKADAVRKYGGEPVFVSTDELFGYMRSSGWEGQDYAFVHPWTNRDVLIGHGSAGFEIIEDMPDRRNGLHSGRRRRILLRCGARVEGAKARCEDHRRRTRGLPGTVGQSGSREGSRGRLQYVLRWRRRPLHD